MLFTNEYLQQPTQHFFQRLHDRPQSAILKDDVLLGMVEILVKKYPHEFKEQERSYFGDTKLSDHFMNVKSESSANSSIQPLMPKELLLTILTREKFFRKEMSQLIKQQGIKQILVLGSGLDSISIRKNHFAGSHDVQFFEIDSEENISLKQELFSELQRKSDNVNYLAADYTKADYLDQLADRGFQFTVPTVVIWGGNSMYLNHEQFKSVLSLLHDRFNGNTLYVTFDYLHTNAVNIETAKLFDEKHHNTLLEQMIQGMKAKLNIDFKGYDPDQMPALSQSFGFTLYKHITAAQHLKEDIKMDDAPVYSEEVYSYAVLKNRI